MAIDASKYTRARASVNEDHLTKQASNERGRFLAQKRGNRQRADSRRNFGRQQAGFMESSARRGLTGGGVKSGAFQQALRQRTGDYTRQVGRFEDDAAEQQRGFDMSAAALDRQRDQMLRQIEEDRQREIAMAALQLKALKPLYG